MWNFDIIFIHGAWAGGWFFKRWSAAFASEGWSAKAITLPGHGPGEDPAGWSLLDYADEVEESVWQPERTVLVGHSMGGWVAMKVLERLPLAATVLLSPVPPRGLNTAVTTALTKASPGAAVKSIIFGRPQSLSEKVVRMACFNESSEEDAIKRFIANSMPESPKALREIAKLGWRLPGKVRIRKRKLKKAGGYKLIVASEGDFFVKPGDLEDTARLLGAETIKLKTYPHCYPYIDKGAAVRELVRDRLERELA